MGLQFFALFSLAPFPRACQVAYVADAIERAWLRRLNAQSPRMIEMLTTPNLLHTCRSNSAFLVGSVGRNVLLFVGSIGVVGIGGYIGLGDRTSLGGIVRHSALSRDRTVHIAASGNV